MTAQFIRVKTRYKYVVPAVVITASQVPGRYHVSCLVNRKKLLAHSIEEAKQKASELFLQLTSK